MTFGPYNWFLVLCNLGNIYAEIYLKRFYFSQKLKTGLYCAHFKLDYFIAHIEKSCPRGWYVFVAQDQEFFTHELKWNITPNRPSLFLLIPRSPKTCSQNITFLLSNLFQAILFSLSLLSAVAFLSMRLAVILKFRYLCCYGDWSQSSLIDNYVKLNVLTAKKMAHAHRNFKHQNNRPSDK